METYSIVEHDDGTIQRNVHICSVSVVVDTVGKRFQEGCDVGEGKMATEVRKTGSFGKLRGERGKKTRKNRSLLFFYRRSSLHARRSA